MTSNLVIYPRIAVLHERSEDMKKIPKDFSGALSFEKNFSKTKGFATDLKPRTKEQGLDSKTREEPDGKGKKTDVVAKCVPDDALLGMTWHHSHARLRVTPSKILKQLPQRIDHVAFADPILRSASQTDQQREPPKEDLSECIEFMTDTPNDKVISASDRNREQMIAKVNRQKKAEKDCRHPVASRLQSIARHLRSP